MDRNLEIIGLKAESHEEGVKHPKAYLFKGKMLFPPPYAHPFICFPTMFRFFNPIKPNPDYFAREKSREQHDSDLGRALYGDFWLLRNLL